MQSTGQASTQAVSFTPMQGSAMTYAIGHLLLQSYASRREDSSEAGVKLLASWQSWWRKFRRYSTAGNLRGAAEVWINEDVPHIKQPFWDVEPVPVPLAPTAQFIR